MTKNFIYFSDEDTTEEKKSEDKTDKINESDDEMEENSIFFISTQPSSKEPVKVREPSEEPSDSEKEENDENSDSDKGSFFPKPILLLNNIL